MSYYFEFKERTIVCIVQTAIDDWFSENLPEGQGKGSEKFLFLMCDNPVILHQFYTLILLRTKTKTKSKVSLTARQLKIH